MYLRAPFSRQYSWEADADEAQIVKLSNMSLSSAICGNSPSGKCLGAPHQRQVIVGLRVEIKREGGLWTWTSSLQVRDNWEGGFHLFNSGSMSVL